MLKWWMYILIGVFLMDFIYRTFFKKKINLKSINTTHISNLNENENIYFNISTSKKESPLKYDKKKFDPEIIHFYSQENSKNYEAYNNEDDDDDEIVSPHNINRKKLDEDEIEFEGLIPKPKKRLNITIEYDDKYQNLYDELTIQLDGNITYLNFYPKKFEIEGGKKIFRYFLFFSMATCCICFAFIEKIIGLCCNNMPESLLKFLSIFKFFLSGLSYLFHMYFIKKISHSNLFEVYVEQKLLYSTFKKEAPPNYVILFNIIKNFKNNE